MDSVKLLQNIFQYHNSLLFQENLNKKNTKLINALEKYNV